ncbi:thioredoxin [Staphylococcus pragensis]|uniref:Thioredoxin n=1 Tax=Staphylococcus pragensis TaxID=1611836 RepID=A0A4Z1C4S6_9STAP|nr:thioredoxin family protein [Staphylococcus pragensis]RTX89951.1 thioredoxin [Staphylococcus carnosus]TGN27391.1 thioredoxin [Staphylococcus pragensis]GGG93053.1 thiol reductase thioredoxin [Staphylococcus pragensis]
MIEQLNSIEQYQQFIETHPLAVIHVMRDHCSVCHAVLPQIQDIVNEYNHAAFGVINQSEVEAIAGELSIFTVPVDLIFLDGKEMHRQARFIDMQSFEHQLQLMNDSLQ